LADDEACRLVWGLLRGLMRRIRACDLRCEFDPEHSACANFQWHARPAEVPPSPPVNALQDARAARAADVAAPWTLARLADTLGLSPRSLQRRLKAECSGFSAL